MKEFMKEVENHKKTAKMKTSNPNLTKNASKILRSGSTFFSYINGTFKVLSLPYKFRILALSISTKYQQRNTFHLKRNLIVMEERSQKIPRIWITSKIKIYFCNLLRKHSIVKLSRRTCCQLKILILTRIYLHPYPPHLFSISE